MSREFTHCVVWRSGGTENFQWHRSLAMSKDDAIARANELDKAGYKTYVADYDKSVSIGLPDTYDPMERARKTECAECGGTGTLLQLGGDWGKTPDRNVPCWKCKGTGKESTT